MISILNIVVRVTIFEFVWNSFKKNWFLKKSFIKHSDPTGGNKKQNTSARGTRVNRMAQTHGVSRAHTSNRLDRANSLTVIFNITSGGNKIRIHAIAWYVHCGPRVSARYTVAASYEPRTMSTRTETLLRKPYGKTDAYRHRLVHRIYVQDNRRDIIIIIIMTHGVSVRPNANFRFGSQTRDR